MTPPHLFANRHQVHREDMITTKFTREPVDVDDTVPVDLYSRPYERVELEQSTAYELIDVEQEVEFTDNFERAPAIELIERFDSEAADQTADLADPPSRSGVLRVILAISMLGAAFGFGVGVGFLVH